MNRKLSICLGIDLGTTNTVVGYFTSDKVEILENNEGSRLTPSKVLIKDDKSYEVGFSAAQKVRTHPGQVFSFFKKLIGVKFTEVKHLSFPFKFRASSNGDAELVDSKDRSYSPIFMSSLVLGEIKKFAEGKLGGEISDVVITVPAHFNNDQREATKEAGKLAGFNVLKIVVEPTAATMACLPKGATETVLVYDLGGGTFDVSVLDISDDVYEVKATEGDTQLGGYDFDEVLLKQVASKVKSDTGKDLFSSYLAHQVVREHIEKAKVALSSKTEVDLVIPYLDKSFTVNGEPYMLEMTLTRSEFNNQCRQLIDKTLDIITKALGNCSKSTKDITKVIMVGGMSRMPAVREAVEKMFGKHKVITKHNPDEIVAEGAAIHGHDLVSDDVSEGTVTLVDATPLSLGIETLGGVFSTIVEKGVAYPISRSERFTTAEDNQTHVRIAVYQGERSVAVDNHYIGSFELSGIEPKRRGEAMIEVKFDINSDGMLEVSAKDTHSGKEQKISFDSNLSKEKVEEMRAEAAKFKEEDKKKGAFLEAKNVLHNFMFEADKSLKDELKETTEYQSLSEAISKAKEVLELKDFNQKQQVDDAAENLRTNLQAYMLKVQELDQGSQSGKPDGETKDAEQASDSQEATS